jgi:hypothetical protein
MVGSCCKTIPLLGADEAAFMALEETSTELRLPPHLPSPFPFIAVINPHLFMGFITIFLLTKKNTA